MSASLAFGKPGVFLKSGITIRGAGIGSTIVDQNLLGRGFHGENVTNVTIRDTVPPYTTLQVPPAPSVTQGTVDLTQVATTGELAGVVGTLLPGQSASLRFAIQVQPQ